MLEDWEFMSHTNLLVKIFKIFFSYASLFNSPSINFIQFSFPIFSRPLKIRRSFCAWTFGYESTLALVVHLADLDRDGLSSSVSPSSVEVWKRGGQTIVGVGLHVVSRQRKSIRQDKSVSLFRRRRSAFPQHSLSSNRPRRCLATTRRSSFLDLFCRRNVISIISKVFYTSVKVQYKTWWKHDESSSTANIQVYLDISRLGLIREWSVRGHIARTERFLGFFSISRSKVESLKVQQQNEEEKEEKEIKQRAQVHT